MATGGEVFVLDMGKPVKIVDLALDLIELSGLVPHFDIKIKYTGIRPGEKLFEELLTAREGSNGTKHKKIYIANIEEINENQLQQGLMALQQTIYDGDIISIIKKLVPTYVNKSYVGEKIASNKNSELEVGLDDRIGKYQNAARTL